ncbi:serine hydrolase domain-containing protein [Algoriphagus sp. CAU 1675]|uniref:serine hydrolase domain-containing protein n=1 Tax=Algoriphagus sp. CAU 1675 TaxID=3032597 RepID=UPI0023DC3D69|nr:serine hydrolase domain-containing protein [Algoriphagus sp. CAU 1675]MDF2158544.1 serine hydrolase [Algoriphagus sp. CAU 1675]
MMKPSILLNFDFSFGKIVAVCWAFCSFSCAEAQTPSSVLTDALYFPPNGSSEWEKTPLAQLTWNQSELGELLAWLPTQGTRAFMIIKDGKIVVEEYWGNKLTNSTPMDQDSYWYWASAGKTLTAAMVGVGAKENILDLQSPTQNYLGEGWTSMTAEQEQKIKLIHHLTFTTGISDQVDNLDRSTPDAFTYLSNPGTRWSYHNGTYTILDKVIELASGMEYQQFFEEKIGKKIGMKGFWQQTGLNNVFYSDARSFARFGLLLLAEGNWNGIQVLSREYVSKMSKASQIFNRSYGYLTWLNGQSNFMLPSSQMIFPGSLVPSAPEDMFQAMGKNGQLLMVIPSQNLIVLRMGTSDDTNPVPFLMIHDIWERLSRIIPSE